MYDIIDQLNLLVPGYMFVFARITAMLVTMPVFSYPMITPRIRTLLAFALALIVGSIVGVDSFPEVTSVWQMVSLMAKEILIGMIIGFGARMIFEGFAIAGAVVGLQMGLAMANVMDPTTRNNAPIVSQFWMLVMVLFFLAMDGHLFLVETLFRNFQLIPLGLGELTADAGDAIVKGGSRIYQLGIQFVAPAMVFLLLVDAGIGFMARVMPQMNVFFVALPLKIGMGIIMLIASLNIFQLLFDVVYNDMVQFTVELVGKLS